MIFSVKYDKNVKLVSGSRGPHGPDLRSPYGRKSQLSVHTLSVDGRSICRNVSEKLHDSRHDKRRKHYSCPAKIAHHGLFTVIKVSMLNLPKT